MFNIRITGGYDATPLPVKHFFIKRSQTMKDLDKCCSDCPTREIMPEIAQLMHYITDHHPDVSQYIQAEGRSPMFAAVMVMKTQTDKIHKLEENK